MKITKLVHSCLVIEHENQKFLVDPGNYSWQSGIVSEDHLTNVDAVIITHAHPDHLDETFAGAIKRLSPNAVWYGPGQVVEQLSAWGTEALVESDNPKIKFIFSKHADLAPWFPEQPEHSSYVLFEEVLVGGDCHTLEDRYGARIFAGAINGGPWGSVVGFMKMIESMPNRPQLVLPLHDWHWNEEARKAIYARLPDVFGSLNVEFVALENGIVQEL